MTDQTPETKHMPSEREIEAVAMALYGDGWEHKATVGNKKYCYEKAVEMLTAASQSRAQVGGQWKMVLPEEGAFIIWFDDADRSPEIFCGTGAREAALARFEIVSGGWNAHLFAKVKSNYAYPVDTYSPLC